MTVPFDAAVGMLQFVDSKIVPDEQIGEHRLAFGRQLQQVAIGLPSGPSPIVVVLKIKVVAVVDILHRRKHAGGADSFPPEQRLDVLKGKIHMLDAAVDMTVDDP